MDFIPEFYIAFLVCQLGIISSSAPQISKAFALKLSKFIVSQAAIITITSTKFLWLNTSSRTSFSTSLLSESQKLAQAPLINSTSFLFLASIQGAIISFFSISSFVLQPSFPLSSQKAGHTKITFEVSSGFISPTLLATTPPKLHPIKTIFYILRHLQNSIISLEKSVIEVHQVLQVVCPKPLISMAIIRCPSDLILSMASFQHFQELQFP